MLDIDETRETAPVSPAATLILLRDSPNGAEVLLMERTSRHRFMAGAYVFPGGRVDSSDMERGQEQIEGDIAKLHRALREPDIAQSAGIVFAAIRETIEEVGIVIGAAPDSELVTRWQNETHDTSTKFDISGLVCHAKWTTPKVEKRRYCARFFAVIVKDEQQTRVNPTEVASHRWWTPAQAIDAFIDGEIQLAPPTLKTLALIRDTQQANEALTILANEICPTLEPEFVAEPRSLVLPGDPLHSQPERQLDGKSRFVEVDGKWILT